MAIAIKPLYSVSYDEIELREKDVTHEVDLYALFGARLVPADNQGMVGTLQLFVLETELGSWRVGRAIDGCFANERKNLRLSIIRIQLNKTNVNLVAYREISYLVPIGRIRVYWVHSLEYKYILAAIADKNVAVSV